MNLTNKKISVRQGFRVSILECITISMVIVPYLTLTTAGTYHVCAFLLGLLLVVAYGFCFYFFSTRLQEGYLNAIEINLGWAAKLLEVLYILRYVIRAALIVLFFSTMVQQYLMRSFPLWWIVVVFACICGYGAAREMEGRGRLMELLFWWMLVPVILMVVFSITNLDFGVIREMLSISPQETSEGDLPLGDIAKGAYGVLLSLSPMELLLYNLPAQKKMELKNHVRLMVWIVLALFLSYCFILGILGEGWTKSSPTAALNVMESATVPGGALARFDYPVMAFWIIGVFAVMSGFMHHTKDYVQRLFHVRTQAGRRWCVVAVTGLVLACAAVYRIPEVGDRVMQYLLYVDLAVGLLLPAILCLVKTYSVKRIGKVAVVLTTLLLGVFVGWFDGGMDSRFLAKQTGSLSQKQSSLEHRDYVLGLEVKEADDRTYAFTFSVADLADYKGDQSLKKKQQAIRANNLQGALDKYYEKHGRQLDIGHIKEIDCYVDGEARRHLLLEMGEMPGLSKSVKVRLDGDKKEKYILRNMIKAAYGRVDL